ncbi:ATP-grasp domain-containing protein [Candidatus Nanopelagicales bacterium]|nr:ATP-grasp domain-containing protein [Candidatus Nanopelagicales bacterium]
MSVPSISRSTAVVVDGHSTGTFLADELAGRGIAAIHVQTGDYGAESLREDTRYLQRITYNGSVADVVDQFNHSTPICCVLPGLEGDGVLVADQLAASLGLPGNPPESSQSRRDKAAMASALAQAGVSHIPHKVSSNVDSLLNAWQSWGSQRAVVKPPASAGSEDVHPCETAAEIRAAVSEIVGKINACEQRNAAAMLQPFISGDEYVVNAVSSNGQHCITDIWYCKKEPGPAGTPIDIYSDLLDARTVEAQILATYTMEVLDAVGIAWGASHAEVILSEQGPVLVEVGARLMGGSFDFNALRRTGAYSQLETLVDAYVSPASFQQKLAKPYSVVQEARTADLQPNVTGLVRGVDLREIRALDSYLMNFVAVAPGDEIAAPIDRNTHIGFVTLAHPDRAVMQLDYEKLRCLESTIFDVAPANI